MPSSEFCVVRILKFEEVLPSLSVMVLDEIDDRDELEEEDIFRSLEIEESEKTWDRVSREMKIIWDVRCVEENQKCEWWLSEDTLLEG